MTTIHLNGEQREIPDSLTLAAMLEWLKLPADRIAVERNLEIVPRGRWRETAVQEGDRFEVVQFVGGGSEFGIKFWTLGSKTSRTGNGPYPIQTRSKSNGGNPESDI